MKIILIYGPQGSGKSTQARLIADKLNLTLISTGEISRTIASQPTPQGQRVKALIDAGEPTPTEILVPAVEEVMRRNQSGSGFVFDGYPRFAQQIEPLLAFISSHGWEVSKVIVIELESEEGIKRIMSRARIEGRRDDNPESIRRRLELYHQQTIPIINYFKKVGKVTKIDGSGTIEHVHSLVLQACND